MLLILYGAEGVEIEDKLYISSLDNVVNINPYIFSTCITEINDRISQNQGGKPLQSWWKN